jgi:Na+-driven multidrug efflux pump
MVENILLLFGIISKTLIFALPRSWNNTRIYSIAGYNYGAENYERVKNQISIKYAALLATLVLSLYSITLLAIFLLVMKNNCRSTKRIALGICRFSCNSSPINWSCLFSSCG